MRRVGERGRRPSPKLLAQTVTPAAEEVVGDVQGASVVETEVLTSVREGTDVQSTVVDTVHK